MIINFGSYLADGLSILKLHTPARCWNLAKMHFYYVLARYLGKYRSDYSPIRVSIEPTTSCNLGCSQCISGTKSFTRAEGTVRLEKYKQWISELKPEVMWLNLYFQGEPLIHKEFGEMVRMASSKNMYVYTSTNGHFMSEESAMELITNGLNRIVFSIDGTTQTTYQTYRTNGDLQKVMSSVRALVHARKMLKKSNPYIVIQYIVFGHNEHEMNEMKQLARSLAVDELLFKTAQVYDLDKDQALLPKKNKHRRYTEKEILHKQTIGANKKGCMRMWQGNVVTWDGNVVPCCFDKDAKYPMGNLSMEPMGKIWSNLNYDHFRKNVFENPENVDICSNCTEGRKVHIAD